jgi:hypothetical protein
MSLLLLFQPGAVAPGTPLVPHPILALRSVSRRAAPQAGGRAVALRAASRSGNPTK